MIASRQRWVRVIVETHSSLLLLKIQTLVANEIARKDKVILHWFSRDADGDTNIVSSELDEQGAFGNWPEDFSRVELNLENEFLKAIEKR